jgi:hypothetical protein
MAARRKFGWLMPTFLVIAVAFPLTALAVSDAERIAVYKEFRAQYDWWNSLKRNTAPKSCR